ncbi:MAG: RNA polymerase sigma-54 factor, partial [Calditrichaeota bacterium]|nr:RNA polymerase sigma-54 factor [Calditrichota bacterium]
LEIIEKLNPKPSEGFFNQKMNYIIPDFIIEIQEDEIIVMLNDWNTPNLRISKRYQALLNSKSKNKSAKSFIRKKMEAAKWFISSIEQRKITMLKVMNAIVEEQRDFFLKGPHLIKPLIMKTIAERINMDISTVSRVTNGKYVQTEFGIFELKSFFSEKMETLEGEEVSTKLIKEKIREICEAEDKKKPLSDEVISTQLLDFGYKVARRTVAKYREQLGVPVARLRREIV